MKNKRKVIKILQEISGKKRVAESVNLRTGLGLDSLEMVRLMIALEERLGVELAEADMDPAALRTVRDVVTLAEKYSGESE